MENTKIDFKYSFVALHGLWISLHQVSEKCLLDSSSYGVIVLWSDDDLTELVSVALYGQKNTVDFWYKCWNCFDTMLLEGGTLS